MTNSIVTNARLKRTSSAQISVPNTDLKQKSTKLSQTSVITNKFKLPFRAVLRMLGAHGKVSFGHPKSVKHIILFLDTTPNCQEIFVRYQICIENIFFEGNYQNYHKLTSIKESTALNGPGLKSHLTIC